MMIMNNGTRRDVSSRAQGLMRKFPCSIVSLSAMCKLVQLIIIIK